MKTYRLLFLGRPVGSIGLRQVCSIEVQAEDEAAARLKAYETHEHITHVQFREVQPT